MDAVRSQTAVPLGHLDYLVSPEHREKTALKERLPSLATTASA